MFKIRHVCATGTLLGTLTIAGCASFPTKEFNKDASPALHSIAVAPIGLPDAPNIMIINAVGNSFGLVGALVEATRASNASKEAVSELSAGGFEYKTYFPAQIDSAQIGLVLEASGGKLADRLL